MVKKIFRKLQKLAFPTFLLLIVGIVCWQNFEPRTWFSGWDTLHPEFNFPLYFKRTFSGAWQEHQGVGAPAAQAHVAELPRLFIVFLLDIFFPDSFVRYGFFFLTLFVGALGMYFLLVYVLKGQKSLKKSGASFLGALFYLLNLTTLQHFYVPLEMFATYFAVLPWLFLFTLRFLQKGRRADLLFFCLVTIFAAPMAHTATLFYVYFVLWLVFLFGFQVLTRKDYILARTVKLVVLSLILNTYWLLPNIYYVARHARDVEISRIHSNFSDEAFLQSKSFGTFSDLALQKNFLFNWREYNFESQEFVKLLDEWQIHLARPGVELVGYIVFGIAMVGVIVSVFKKSKLGFSLLPVLGIVIFFWINENFPFTLIYSFLRANISLFRESLRFPFTKFSIFLAFSLAVYFAYGLSFLLGKLNSIKLSLPISVIIFSGLIYFSWPAFRGYLISPSMKVGIPQEYFEMFEWFESQNDNGRVAGLPLYTLWGWGFYSWGYQGAGFSWFGIPQPILDREFDRWSPYNESFYNEASFALYQENLEAFEEVLEKYQVQYLLLDESLINAGGDEKLLYIPEIKELLNKSEHINKEKEFNYTLPTGGFLSVYKTDFEASFVWTPEKFASVKADLTYSEYDPLYQEFGTYILAEDGVLYPFVNFDPRSNIQILIKDSNIHFVRNFDRPIEAKELRLPDLTEKEEVLQIMPDLTKGEGRYDIVLGLLSQTARLCSSPKQKFDLNLQGGGFELEVGKESVCLGQHFSLEEERLLQVSYDFESAAGLSPQYCVTKVGEQGCLNDGLSQFVRLEAGEYWLDFVAQAQEFAKAKIVYKNLEIKTFPYKTNKLSSVLSVSTGEGKEIRVAVSGLAKIGETFSPGRGNAKAINCDSAKQGAVKRQNTDRGVLYRAEEGGVSCDSFYYPSLDYSRAYLMRLKGENREGRSLKIYLQNNKTKRFDIEELLPEGEFDVFFVILPKEIEGAGYTLNLETRSFGRIFSENVLEKIEFVPIPLDWLSEIRFVGDTETGNSVNNLEIKSTQKIGTAFYKVRTKGDGLLVLGQGYEEGWGAFSMTNAKWPMLKKLEHPKVNSWANGWLIPTAPSTVHRSPTTIFIFYWPQLLEYLGFLFLLAIPVILKLENRGTKNRQEMI